MSDLVQVGQIVLWQRYDEELCPAIVTAAHEDGTVNVTIFPDGEGIQTRTQVHQGLGIGEWRLI